MENDTPDASTPAEIRPVPENDFLSATRERLRSAFARGARWCDIMIPNGETVRAFPNGVLLPLPAHLARLFAEKK